MLFESAGIETSVLSPLLVAFAISTCTSTLGISGAFLLLPYQFSILGYTSPGVSATNQIFNIIACPAGVLRYYQEKRLFWPLALNISLGTLPGVFIGAWLRVTILLDGRHFRLFIALILLYLCWRLSSSKKAQKNFNFQTARDRIPTWQNNGINYSLQFGGLEWRIPAKAIFILCLLVGIAGGAYGVGGGALVTPFLVSVFGLPLHAIAGASLLATFITSIAGVVAFIAFAWLMGMPQANPDWLLGILLGFGGLCGMYCGAALQKYIKASSLRYFLAGLCFCMALLYAFQALR